MLKEVPLVGVELSGGLSVGEGSVVPVVRVIWIVPPRARKVTELEPVPITIKHGPKLARVVLVVPMILGSLHLFDLGHQRLVEAELQEEPVTLFRDLGWDHPLTGLQLHVPFVLNVCDEHELTR